MCRHIKRSVASAAALPALVTILVACLAAPASALAQSQVGQTSAVPSRLVEEALSLDGTQVSVEGEAIGDRLHSGNDHVWVNVLGDDRVGIGAWTPGNQADAIQVYGDYGHVGDRVRVVGVLNAACDLHGGDLDIHVIELSVLEAGYVVEEDAEPIWAIVGAVGIFVALTLERIHRSRRR